ncbi:hypothetical protein N9349_05295 [Candidatus Pelagibacter sp.]|nr:hypothetical protein [Candidatus Pelagibacter sp.]
MAYIGRQPTVGNFQICDAISVVNGQAAYTMQVASVNVIPETANHMIVSLNGVIQKPGSSYTVSGSTITFFQNLVTGDVIDFIQILGSVLDIGTPSDGTVTESKIGSNAVTTAKITDANITSAKMFSGFANGITMADQWRLTASTNSGTDADITANWERVDDASFEKIGTGMTENSGVYSFPSTGKYLITEVWTINVASGDTCQLQGQVTLDNSSYDNVTDNILVAKGGAQYMMGANQSFIDVTDISNVKIKWKTASFASGTVVIGSTDQNRSSVSFLRIGDT